MSTVARRSRSVFRDLLPTGRALSPESWRTRHHALFALLILHIPGIAVYGLATGTSLQHSILEASIIGLFAAAAVAPGLDKRTRAALTTMGLTACSAVLVHLSGGLIEMHFHFFIMVAIVALYQDWVPFLLAIGFVVAHHGLMGALDVTSVYNHPDAIAHPWKWALIHGTFIAGQSLACIAAWKVNEIGMDREREAREELQGVNEALAEAQAMSSLGSWDWDIPNSIVKGSDELYRILCVTPDDLQSALQDFLDLLHEDDRDRVATVVQSAIDDGNDFSYEARLMTPDGTIKNIEATGKVIKDAAGNNTRMAGTLQDVSARRTLEEEVQYQAFHDSLTGLPNRALFLDRVEHALAKRERHAAPLALLFIDIDDFKTVNDSLGHRAGDELLKVTADRIQKVLRSVDTVCRLGGDEFAILLEDIEDEAEATAVALRILQILRRAIKLEDQSVHVRASIGIAFTTPDEGLTPGELLRNADTAMYATKHGGKDGFSLFQQQMQEAANERSNLKADLENGIANRELVVHYQPIVDLATGNISSLEALVRWNSPKRGMVPPLEFIPFAEETGLIQPITRFVLTKACAQAVAWQEIHPLQIAVNISAVGFRDEGFVEEVAAILKATGLAPELLTLEITESIFVQEASEVRSQIDELKALGVNLAIDDFGTGYSSLSYLNDFPIDIIKIDKAFIDSVALGPEESALARAVIKLGQTLNKKVVAEGVEEREQAVTLDALGCAYAQGFLFSKPVDKDSITLLLHAERKLPKGPRPRSLRPEASPEGTSVPLR